MARKKSSRPSARFRGQSENQPPASAPADVSPEPSNEGSSPPASPSNEGSSPPASPSNEGSSAPNEGSSDDPQATIQRLTKERDEARRLVELADHGLPIEAKNALCEFTAGHVTAYEMNLVLRSVLEQSGIEVARQVAAYISEREPRKAGQVRIKMETIEALARVKQKGKSA